MKDLTKLTVVPCEGGWIIEGYLDGPVGVYDSKKEAEETRRRLLNMERHGHKPGYVTCERS